MWEQSAEGRELGEDGLLRLFANGTHIKTAEVEANLDHGNIQEAESSLREGLSINSEEARALLGRLEYQRGNVEGAIHVFDGIDLQAAIKRHQPALSEKPDNKKAARGDSQHAASLVIEAVYLKAKSFQKLGKFFDAARECASVVDTVGNIFPQGIPDGQLVSRLRETVSHAVELLPELWKQAGNYKEAVSAYRSAVLRQWNLDTGCWARILKAFAVFLLYSGVGADAPSLGVQTDGAYIPRNNLEEAILVLMILLQKYSSGKIKWDPSLLEHLKFALSISSQTSVLAKQLEEIMPGVLQRVDRWNTLALCFMGAGQNKSALNVLRKSLHKHECPDDVMRLLFAAKICSGHVDLVAEGVGYAQAAINKAEGKDETLKGVGLRILGLCLGKQAKNSLLNSERSRLQAEALKSLDAAITLEMDNPELDFDMGIEYAEQGNLRAALHHTRRYIDATGGSILKGWRLLALILSAQQRFPEAEAVIDAALEATAKWEQWPLLRLKAKIKTCQSKLMEAVETYRYLLALVQAQRKSFGTSRNASQVEDARVNEFEVWHGLANLYSRLSHWKDVEICLNKARELKQYSADLLYVEGVMNQERGQTTEAMSAFVNSLLFQDSPYLPSKILVGSLLSNRNSNSLPVARALLSDALSVEPTNRKAWFQLGMVHKNDGRISDAIECFQAASMLEDSTPLESFSSII